MAGLRRVQCARTVQHRLRLFAEGPARGGDLGKVEQIRREDSR
jgi:hypothetical protein